LAPSNPGGEFAPRGNEVVPLSACTGHPVLSSERRWAAACDAQLYVKSRNYCGSMYCRSVRALRTIIATRSSHKARRTSSRGIADPRGGNEREGKKFGTLDRIGRAIDRSVAREAWSIRDETATKRRVSTRDIRYSRAN